MSTRARALLLACALGCAAAVAADARADAKADQDAGLARFEKGLRLFNLGRFDEAIAELDAAYQLDPEPVYLYNLAQAHRLKGDPRRALFFYQRYLDEKPTAPNRADVEQRIALLEAELAEAAATSQPVAPTTLPAPTTQPSSIPVAPVVPTSTPPSPSRWRLGLEVGWAIVRFPGLDEEPPPQLTERAWVTYALRDLGFATLDLAGMLQLVTIPYDTITDSYTASYVQTTVGARLRRALGRRFDVRIGAAAGFSRLGNLRNGNPFTEGQFGVPDQGSLVVRADATLGFRLVPSLRVLTTFGAVSWSGRSADLHPDTKGIYTIESLFLGLEAEL